MRLIITNINPTKGIIESALITADMSVKTTKPPIATPQFPRRFSLTTA